MVMKLPTTYANEIKSSTRYISMIAFRRLFHQQFLMPTKLSLYIDGIFSRYFLYFSSSVSCVLLCLWSRRNYINFLSLIISSIFTNHIFKGKKSKATRGLCQIEKYKVGWNIECCHGYNSLCIGVEKYTIEILIRKTQFRCFLKGSFHTMSRINFNVKFKKTPLVFGTLIHESCRKMQMPKTYSDEQDSCAKYLFSN